MYTIEQNFIGASANYPTLSGVKYIVAHDTGNDNSTIDNEITYMRNNWQNAFVTDFVGNGRIVNIAQHGQVSWGAGPNANPYSWAQVEWVHAHSQSDFDASYKMYVWYLRYLATQAGLPLRLNQGSGIVTHGWVSNNLGGTDHMDPDAYLKKWGVSMDKFAYDIANGLGDTPIASPQNQNGIVNARFIATVNYKSGYGINAVTSKGVQIKGTNAKFLSGTTWQVSEVRNGLNKVSNTEWLPSDNIWLTHYNAQSKATGGIAIMSKPVWEKRYIKKTLNSKDLYVVQELRRVGKDLWINFGGEQWTLAKYFNLYIGTK